MNNPFGGGYAMATVVYPETMTVLCGIVPYEYEVDMSKAYEWEFATVREGGVNRPANIAEMAQIARFFDNGRSQAVNSRDSAMTSLKAFIAYAIAVYRQSQNYDYQKAAA